MKKLLGLTLALAMILPSSQASAELLKNFKLSGQLDLQTQASRNVADFITRQSASATDHGAGGGLTAGDKDAAGHPTYNDRLNNAQTRLLLHMDWDLLDDVHAKITLAKRSRTWGTNGAAGAGNGTAQVLDNTATGASVLGSIYVDQAYFKVMKVMGALDATFGRQYYGNSGDLVIYYGPSDKALHGLPTTSLDAARVDWMGDMANLTAIAGKTTGSPIATFANADVDVRGLDAGFKVMDGLKINGRVYNRLTHGTSALGSDRLQGRNDDLWVYGLKLRYEAMGFSLGIEGDRNAGSNRTGGAATTAAAAGVAQQTEVNDAHYRGFAWLFDASFKMDMEGMGSVKPWASLGWGSGRKANHENQNANFTAISGDYRPGTIYGRFAPSGLVTLGQGIPCLVGAEGCTTALAAGNVSGSLVNGVSGTTLSNRVIWGLGLEVGTGKLTSAVSFWDYRFQRRTSTHNLGGAAGNGLNGLGLTGDGSGNGNKHIGNELDLDFTWKHSDNVSFGTGVASFRPGKYIQEVIKDQVRGGAATTAHATQVSHNSAILAYFDARLKF